MLIEIFALLLGVSAFAYFYVTRKYGSYEALGIKEDPPTFPFGSRAAWDLVTRKSHAQTIHKYAIDAYPDEKMILVWTMSKPAVVINDMEIAKNILVKDFARFVDRREFPINKEANKYFINMLTMLKGERWKKIRSIITPIFTSGKLKHMKSAIDEISTNLISHIDSLPSDQLSNVDVKELFLRYTTDTIAVCGFGVKSDCVQNPDNNEFFKRVLSISGRGEKNYRFLFFFLYTMLLPSFISRRIKMSLMNSSDVEFFVEMIRQSMNNRKKDRHTRRNDLLDLLLDELEKYSSNDVKEEDKPEEETQFDRDAKLKISPDQKLIEDDEIETILIANAFILLFAGFEVTSTILAATLYFLAVNPEAQDNLYREIESAVAENGGNKELGYAKLQEMQYLDNVINESMRLYGVGDMERVALEDYKVEGTNMTIKKGTTVFFPTNGIMKSEKYFDNPTEFRPERFAEDNKHRMNIYSILSFGHGPRNCVGMRFALLQMKVVLSRILYNYEILKCSKTVDNIVWNTHSQNADPVGGLWVQLKPRDR